MRFVAFVLLGLLCAHLQTSRHVGSAAHSASPGSPSSKSLSSYDGEANALLSKMTLEEKIGQMTQAEQDALKDINDIEKYFLGSLLSGETPAPATAKVSRRCPPSSS